MRILVAGKEGQLARCLADCAGPGLEIVALGRPELDITQRPTIDAAIAAHSPDIVINAAAYTAVDKAEDDEAAAHAINAEGAGNVAAAAASAGLPVLHVSTDYVFAGDAAVPYRESDPVAPLGVYGRSKQAGESAVAKANANHMIFRTAWVHSPYGGNFVKTMLRLAGDREVVNVVADQTGSPTSAEDLADALVRAARHALSHPQDADWRGTFHAVGAGSVSWAGFAEEIFRQSEARGGPSARVEPIATSQYPTRAKRPAFSVLDTAKLASTFGQALPAWQDGLARTLSGLLRGA